MKKSLLFVILGTQLLLAGCAPTNLKAPCPDFGKYCAQIPINSWNYKTV